MSRVFGAIRQNGYVVEDLDRAIGHWVDVLGIGPFFKAPHLKLEHYSYRGEESAPDLSIALAYSGDLQIELIQQHNDAPSSYRDFLRAHGPGLQHFCTFANGDYDGDRERFRSLGLRVNSEGKLLGGGRFTYYDTEGHAGTIVEFGEGAPATREVFEKIRLASVNWNGEAPVRNFGFTQ